MRFLVFLTVLAFSIPAAAQVLPMTQTQGVFRNFVWGVSPNDVTEFESAKYYKSEGDSVYFVELPAKKDFRRVIRYDFKDRKLWRANYEYQEFSDPDSNQILYKHEDFKRELIKTYGEPVRDEYIWKDKTYRTHPEYWGRALRAKNVRMETEWQLPDTKVVLELFYNGPFYQMAYTAEQVSAATMDKSGVLLDLPPAQKPEGAAAKLPAKQP